LACRFSVVQSGRPGKESVAEVVSYLKGKAASAVARQFGGASAIATAKPSGREVMRSPCWDVKKSTCAVISATRSSSLSKAGMKTVAAKSRCARSSGSPWGCSPPSSLPLCGSVMTPNAFCARGLTAHFPSEAHASPFCSPLPAGAHCLVLLAIEDVITLHSCGAPVGSSLAHTHPNGRTPA
jgi:hypothetical protein